jgi:hypothetical protein
MAARCVLISPLTLFLVMRLTIAAQLAVGNQLMQEQQTARFGFVPFSPSRSILDAPQTATSFDGRGIWFPSGL